MAKNKTTETIANVVDFVSSVIDPIKRADCFQLIEIMQSVSGFEAKMWGPSIIGFGSYHYVYESGREGDAPIIAFSPRATALVFYLSLKPENRENYLAQLGKHKTEKGCIYVKKLADISIPILEKMLNESIQQRTQKI